MSRAGETCHKVAELLAAGVSRNEIARRLSISRSTVTYHARRLGAGVAAEPARRYDWSAVQAYHDSGNGMLACMRTFGFTRQAWSDAVARGALVARPHARPIDELLRGARNRAHLRKRLVRAGLLEERCDVCGLVEWRGRPIVLQLHHVNGVGDDHRLENLQLLCPNCHSQTANWGGRNRGRGLRDAGAAA